MCAIIEPDTGRLDRLRSSLPYMKLSHSASALLIAILLVAPLMLGACSTAISSTIDDATISTHVKTAFINDPVVDVARIDVSTANGIVTLSGRVKSRDEEAKAIALARTIKGVAEVKSALQIQP